MRGFAFAAVMFLDSWSIAIFFSNLLRGGFVFYGGLAGGLIALVRVSRSLGLDSFSVASSCAPSFAFAHACGRVGCALAGCCYGAHSNAMWTIAGRHPTQLLEALFLIVLGFALIKIPLRKRRAYVFRGLRCVPVCG